MTTTVVVKARAWGATVVAKTDDQEAETIELGSHQDRSFHIQPGSKMTIEVSEPTEAPVTDEPVEEVMTAQDDPAPPTDAALTDPPAADPAPKKSKAFGGRDFGDDAQS